MSEIETRLKAQAWWKQATADREAALRLQTTALSDLAFDAKLGRRDRVSIPASQWDSWAPDVARLTDTAPINGAFQYWGIWFDRAETAAAAA